MRSQHLSWLSVVLVCLFAMAMTPASGCGARSDDDDGGDDGGATDDGGNDTRDEQRDPFWNVLTEGDMDASRTSATVADGGLRMTASDMAAGERFTVYQAQMEAGFDLSVDFTDVLVAGASQSAFFFVRALQTHSWVMAGVSKASNTGDTIITVQAIDGNAPAPSEAVEAITATAGTIRIQDTGSGFVADVTVGEVTVTDTLTPLMQPPYLVGFTLANFTGDASTGQASLTVDSFYGTATGIEFDEFYWNHLK